jgi:hypothetical protein
LRGQIDHYERDTDVTVLLRIAIYGGAAAIQALVTSFHPRRGAAGPCRDLARVRQSVKAVSDDLSGRRPILIGNQTVRRSDRAKEWKNLT